MEKEKKNQAKAWTPTTARASAAENLHSRSCVWARGLIPAQDVKTFSLLALTALLFAGCATTPVSKTGSTTVTNSNPYAIVNAAQSVFANSGYSAGPADFPNSVAFDKPAGAFGKIMYGSYDQTTTIRCTVSITQIPGTNDYRLGARASTVQDAGEAGFESSRPIVFDNQFNPLLRQIAAQASNAGSM
jgi:uncharacterized protein (UPF0333 family)